MNFEYDHTVRVRYAECDRMGFVHHSVFILYFEEARTEAMRKSGLTYREMEDSGILMPVRSMGVDFKKAGKYDDLLTIRVRILQKPGVRIRFDYETYNQNGEFLNSGYTELFFVRRGDLKPVMLPPVFWDRFKPFFEP
ncbi:MAG: acyl-CoA thioesterase [Bacteroidetes bacterium]|nr:acyl-CoA thioesterase [Bacteroidota bacterium]